MRYPLTVRQAQKATSRFSLGWDDRCELANQIGASYGDKCIARALAQLSAKHGPNHIILASPEVPSSKASDSEKSDARPKGTDEVRPQSDNPSEDSPFHGGDGASGEVEDGQSQGGSNMENSGGDSSSAAGEPSEARKVGAPSPQADAADDAGVMPDQSAPETDKVTSGEANTNQPHEKANGLRADGTPDTDSQVNKSALSTSTDHQGSEDDREGDPQGKTVAKKASDGSGASTDALTGRANQPADNAQSSGQPPLNEAGTCEMSDADTWKERALMPKETGDDDEASSEKGQYHYKKGGTGQSSKKAKHTHGGVTAEMRRVGITSALIKRARKAIARLIEDGEMQTGPRYDWQDFCERFQSYRPVIRARKEEEGRPAILILADVSGSCMGFSDKSLLVARAVAELGVGGADVVIVAHSNGNPVEWAVNGKPPRPIDVDWGESLQWYETVLRRFNLQAVIALGDWDAEWLYHHLAELFSVRRFIWLDNWSCNSLPVTVRDDLFKKGSHEQDHYDWSRPWRFESPWSPQAKAKSTYVVGCAEAEDFLTGIELGIKGIR